jgi:hypothetical protein
MAFKSLQGESSFTVPFTALTESQRFGPYELGADITGVSLDVVVPDTAGTGDPDGDFTIEVGNDPAATAGAVAPECATAAYLAAQPAGGAADFFVSLSTRSNLIWIVYTRASGGTACVPTVKLGFKRA